MTKGEQEYLEIVKRLVKNNQGQLDGERPLLDRQREFFRVSPEAAARIEQRVMSAYQTFLRQSPPFPVPGSRSLVAPTYIPATQQQRSANPKPQPEPIPDTHLPDTHLPDTQLAELPTVLADDTDDQFTPTYRSSSELPSSELAPTVLQSPAPRTEAQPAVSILSMQTELEPALQRQQWQEADQITLELMLKLTGYEAQGWLDAEAMGKLPCNPLHEIDRLWRRYSNEKFGFAPQLQVFARLERLQLPQRTNPQADSSSDPRLDPQARANQPPLFSSNSPRSADLDYQKMLRFCKEVGWWQVGEFHKYYNQLAYHKYENQPALALSKEDVPQGHLPALWYWKISWWRALQLGGLGPSRGGCRVDAPILVSLMTQLQQCEIRPKAEFNSTSSIASRTSTIKQ